MPVKGETMKVGDLVFVGPFEIEQFRDTHNPGPQDSGDTAILRRHPGFGVTSSDMALVVPAVPHLAEIARYLAEHPETVDALALCHSWLNGIDVAWPDDLEVAAVCMSGLVKAMRGETGE